MFKRKEINMATITKYLQNGKKIRYKRCDKCWNIIDEADADVMYLDGHPICIDCFNQFWESINITKGDM